MLVVVARPRRELRVGQVSGGRVGRLFRDQGRSAAPGAPCRPANPRPVVAQPPQKLRAYHIVGQEPTA